MHNYDESSTKDEDNDLYWLDKLEESILTNKDTVTHVLGFIRKLYS